MFLELNILYMIKVTILIFRNYFSSYFVWKTAKTLQIEKKSQI